MITRETIEWQRDNESPKLTSGALSDRWGEVGCKLYWYIAMLVRILVRGVCTTYSTVMQTGREQQRTHI